MICPPFLHDNRAMHKSTRLDTQQIAPAFYLNEKLHTFFIFTMTVPFCIFSSSVKLSSIKISGRGPGRGSSWRESLQGKHLKYSLMTASWYSPALERPCCRAVWYPAMWLVRKSSHCLLAQFRFRGSAPLIKNSGQASPLEQAGIPCTLMLHYCCAEWKFGCARTIQFVKFRRMGSLIEVQPPLLCPLTANNSLLPYAGAQTFQCAFEPSTWKYNTGQVYF